MKYKLAKTHSRIVLVLLIVIFCIGVYMQQSAEGNYAHIAGMLCQTLAFFFTIIPSFFNRHTQQNDIPLDCFVDRRDIIEYVFERLREIGKGQSQDRYIEIQCGPEIGIGKTELLNEIRSLLINPRSAKEFFSRKSFNRFKLLYSRIGSIHYIEWETNRTEGRISSYPKTLFKTNVFMIDSVPITLPFEAPKDGIIIFTSISKPNYLDANTPNILRPLQRDDIRTYYRNVHKAEINDYTLDRVEAFSRGNISEIKKIIDNPNALKSLEENCYELHSIEELMKVGDYQNARAAFDKYSSVNVDSGSFSDKLLNANLMHLENRYDECLAELNRMVSEYKDLKSQEIIFERIAHVLKHQSKFDESLEALNKLEDVQRTADRSVSTDIMAYSFYEDAYYYDKFLEDLSTIETFSNSAIEEESYLTYRAIRSAYQEEQNRAIEEIDYAIDLYKSISHRRLYNCFFIKGEVLRRFSDYKGAFDCYQQCIIAYKFNNDFDLYAMASLMMQYTNMKAKAEWKYDALLSNDEILSICHEKKIPYIEKLCKKVMRLSNALISREKNKSEIDYFDKYLFLIP